MPTNASMISGEQQIKADFVAAMSHFRPHLAVIDEGQSALDALTEAILRFGTCELKMRKAERLRALGLFEEDAQTLVDTALSHHEKGLAALSAVRPFANVLTSQETEQEALSAWRASSPDIRREWRDEVSEVDVGSADAIHLLRIMDECCDAIDEEGLSGLGHYLSRQIDRLEEARRSDDRGTRAASFPWYKLVAAAVILGTTAYEIWRLITFGAPWWAFWIVAQINCILMLLVALGC